MFPTHVPSPLATIDLAGIKVLAVDDNDDVRELLLTLLLAYGAEVRVVASGAEEDYQRSLDHGFQQHLAKLVEPEQLAIAIVQFGLK